MSALPEATSGLGQLAEAAAAYVDDPLGYVRFAYPWGVEGTALAGFRGPEPWQAEVLRLIGSDLRARRSPVLVAVRSGHGIGKSAMAAMLMDWAMVAPGTRGVVTANTDGQLRTKTWPTLADWQGMSLCEPLHRVENTTFATRGYEKTWRIDAVPWSERNTEAFAGLHNRGKRVLLVFDESSAIPDKLWEVAEGAMTDGDTQVIWVAFGNPTRSTGRFAQCFGKDAGRWHHLTVDSRSVSFTNKTLLEEWRQSYGEDSDFFKVRVKGEPPSQSDLQFIPTALVDEARRRQVFTHPTEPLVGGLDVARSGSAESVLALRRGRDARSLPWLCLRERDSMVLAARVVAHLNDLARSGQRLEALFVDAGGLGGPVADRLRQLGAPVHDVYFGGSGDGPHAWQYRDKSAEMWAATKEWLRDGGAIPDDPELAEQLTSRDSSVTSKGRVYMESKEDMLRRGLPSPDRGDALVLTHAYPVLASQVADASGRFAPAAGGRVLHDYDPYAERDVAFGGGRVLHEYDPYGGR
jgi:hypothetical protein